MANDMILDVLASGAVLLGLEVSCDGFHADHLVRVQTHIHGDHMEDFSTSLGKEVVLSNGTMRLLEQKYPGLDVRSNVHGLEYGQRFAVGQCTIELVSAGHMLGAAQVRVELGDGTAVGYSGDFGWPLDQVIQVDQLVVDATYGSPDSDRGYTQADAQEEFVNLVRRELRNGPVHLMADTGPAERALQLLCIADVTDEQPVIVGERLEWSVKAHREFGATMPEVVSETKPEARMAHDDGHYLRVWGLYSQLPNDGFYSGAVIRLTKYRADPDVVTEVGEGQYHVGFSNHADFIETLEYVEASGASHVVTDNVRGNRNDRAEKLSNAIRAQLGISARVSSNRDSPFWGE